MLNIHDLKAAYEKAIGHETSNSTVYNLRVAPRQSRGRMNYLMAIESQDTRSDGRTLRVEPLAVASVHAVVNEVINHRGIGQGRGVAGLVVLVGGDLTQDAAHDFAGAGLG
jgi:hypothetical protein